MLANSKSSYYSYDDNISYEVEAFAVSGSLAPYVSYLGRQLNLLQLHSIMATSGCPKSPVNFLALTSQDGLFLGMFWEVASSSHHLLPLAI